MASNMTVDSPDCVIMRFSVSWMCFRLTDLGKHMFVE